MGGAQPGDKTLVDALNPAAQVLSLHQDLPLQQALRLAAQAAQDGAQATRGMRAVYGRASFLGERSRGHLDAGAVSLAAILAALEQACQGVQPRQAAQLESQPILPAAGKFINHPDSMVSQDNLGLALAFPGYVRCTADGILVRAQPKPQGRVGLAIGHGGGHTPSMGGLVGPGLLDADVYGPLFTCASGVRIARAVQQAERGAGVILLVSNHAGDVLNARLAQVRAEAQGLRVLSVLSSDDIATASREQHLKRRGLGGLLFMVKVGGAAAEAGQSLEETVRLMQKTNLRTATLSVAARAGTHPVSGLPLFDLPAGQLEVGTGVHGEVGVYRGPHLPADAVVDMLLERLLADLETFQPAPLIAFLNGSGGVSKMELHILYRRVCQALAERGLRLAAGVVDSLFTTQETGGFSLSLLAADEEIWQAWQQPAAGAYFRWPL
jgi:phosphoenolpyruvate---glycerone phosphotransferase subunit DhaK